MHFARIPCYRRRNCRIWRFITHHTYVVGWVLLLMELLCLTETFNKVDIVNVPESATSVVLRSNPDGLVFCYPIQGKSVTISETPGIGPLDSLAIIDFKPLDAIWVGIEAVKTDVRSSTRRNMINKLVERISSGTTTDHDFLEKWGITQRTPLILSGGTWPKDDVDQYGRTLDSNPIKYSGPVRTLPYFYGPIPWLNQYDSEYESRELPKVNDAEAAAVMDLRVLRKILHGLTPTKKEELRTKCGQWKLKDHLARPIGYYKNMDIFFGSTDPYRRTLRWDLQRDMSWDKFGFTKVGADNSDPGLRDGRHLNSTGSFVYYHYLFKPLLNIAGGEDVALVGNEWFMGGGFTSGMAGKNDLRFKYFMSEPLGWNPILKKEPTSREQMAVDAHIAPLRTARFWAFMMHNQQQSERSRAKVTIHFEFTDGAPRKAVTFVAHHHEQLRLTYVSVERRGKRPGNSPVYFWIPDEEALYRRLGVNPPRKYYLLESLDDIVRLRWKAESLGKTDDNIMVVNVDNAKITEELETQCVDFQNAPEGPGNHWWLAIFDKETGELFNHDTVQTTEYGQSLMDKLLNNIGELCKLYGIPTQRKLSIRRAVNYNQRNDHDCGLLALHTLLMFILDRVAAQKRQAKGRYHDDPEQSPAAFKYTDDDFDGRTFRGTLNSLGVVGEYIEHMLAGSRRRAAAKVITDSLGPARLAEKKYYRIADGQIPGTELTYKTYEHKDYSKLKEKYQQIAEAALNLWDEGLGHRNHLDRLWWHLEHAGAVLFSVKNPEDPLNPKGCEKSKDPSSRDCHHDIDIIPIPPGYCVILQP